MWNNILKYTFASRIETSTQVECLLDLDIQLFLIFICVAGLLDWSAAKVANNCQV
jgi:hypothetical protein